MGNNIPLMPLSSKANCDKGVTLNVVAHQDDDLLFLSPDLLHDIQAGRCIRTVYFTAGNAGEDYSYWHSRELGSEAAYAQMYNVPNIWHQVDQVILGHHVSVHYLNGVPQLALTFMRLPDGNLRGQGFYGNDNASLYYLSSGALPAIQSIDKKSSYTEAELIDALLAIMSADKPNEIHTQDYSPFAADGDHSDHHLTGYYTRLARSRHEGPTMLKAYAGYPGRYLPMNLTTEDAAMKEAAFLTYAPHDLAVCQSAAECENSYTYGNYLIRQYYSQE